MKKYVIFNLLILVVYSCDIDFEEDVKYYQFTQEDYKYIPTIYQHVGQVITFKNQEGDQISVQVKGYSENKKSNGGWNWAGGNSIDLYYTDQIIISIQLLDVEFPEIGEDYCSQIHIIIEKNKDLTTTTRLDVPYYDNACFGTHLDTTSPYNNLQNLTFDGVNYQNVTIFNTDRNLLLFNESSINKIYFDHKMGIVGFDDIGSNIQYRILTE